MSSICHSSQATWMPLWSSFHASLSRASVHSTAIRGLTKTPLKTPLSLKGPGVCSRTLTTMTRKHHHPSQRHPQGATAAIQPFTSTSSATELDPYYSSVFLKQQQQRGIRSVGKSQGRVMILGSGWGGFKLLRDMNKDAYQVVAVSPRNHFLFTPLLASTSVGTLEFRCITEPVRGYTRNVEYHQAWCDSVDFEQSKVDCTLNLSPSPAVYVSKSDKPLSTAGMDSLTLSYDHLIIGVGSYSNTFNIPGVKEHAFFLKEVSDARKIRSRVLECFERAEMSKSDEEKNGLLHFAVVGGGPTGVEFSSELHDFIREDCSRLFPGLMNHVTLAVYDVAPTILANFDKSLAEYCMNKFRRSGIEVRTGTVVDKVEDGRLVLKDGKVIPFGCLVWSTGLTENPLTASLEGKVLKSKSKRILTDEYLRVLDPEGKVIPNVYALGDCATIKDHELPQTAQVANQQAIYLRKALNQLAKYPERSFTDVASPFSFKNLGSMAYIGNWEAVVDMTKINEKAKESGKLAWIFWRSSYLTMSVSVRNKMIIPMYWFMTWVFGRDVSSFQEYDRRKRMMNAERDG
ncbi:NADH:ubiquinone reductase (non-electrogenic) [Entomortierella parvispora]|uniref:NADH:ubiquinone reductase (Non-electrogenic) n=1 Tax=Entomortierella parvispora TaxID=205924 RepID=A0A9P3LUQ9_9FUNG|nr:NADH:ubiquinone reductase (non-electrogenic) [Entomortierella parvispora]